MNFNNLYMGEYNILQNAAKKIKNVEGITCEIGVYSGKSSIIIMDALKEINEDKVHIGIDPYGNIDYRHYESLTQKLDYTNYTKKNMLKNIYNYCFLRDMEFLFFPIEDTEFFRRYNDGVPIYNEHKYIINKYALVFFDGPHTTEIVKREFDFFCDKVPLGGVMIFDDINQYPHMEKLDAYIRNKGYEIIEKGFIKISYVKNL